MSVEPLSIAHLRTSIFHHRRLVWGIRDSGRIAGQKHDPATPQATGLSSDSEGTVLGCSPPLLVAQTHPWTRTLARIADFGSRAMLRPLWDTAPTGAAPVGHRKLAPGCPFDPIWDCTVS